MKDDSQETITAGDVETNANFAPRSDPQPAPSPLPSAPPSAPPPASSDAFPRGFGDYELLGSVGEGGMGTVYVGRSKGRNQLVAIKCVKSRYAKDAALIEMFVRESKVAARLRHRAIVRTLEVGCVDGNHFICMEYIAGADLSLILSRSRSSGARRLPMPHTLHIISNVCDALHYAHELVDQDGQPMNLVNRDVSPSNIRISVEGDVKLIDFGIAKLTTDLTSEIGSLKGKKSYMSPEQVRGLPVDRRSDVFSVGTVLYEMLCGESLFRGSSEFQTMERVQRAEVPPPSAANPRVPAPLDDVVMRLLQRQRGERYQNCGEVARDLRQILATYQFDPFELRALVRTLCTAEWAREHSLLGVPATLVRLSPQTTARSALETSHRAMSTSGHFAPSPEDHDPVAEPRRPLWGIYLLLALSVVLLGLAGAFVALGTRF